MTLHDRSSRTLDSLVITDINDLTKNLDTIGTKIGDTFFDATGDSIKHLDLRTFCRQSFDDRAPNSSGTTGHDRHATFKTPTYIRTGCRIHA